MDGVTIKVKRNGSYHVQGPITIRDAEGNDVTFEGDEVWLCRCGHSETKPFCDGTHRRIGFRSEVLAPGREAADAQGSADPV
jgi:3-phenylpropionate/trans-cinnamate dioxygenase ferredoxin subunit